MESNTKALNRVLHVAPRTAEACRSRS